MERGLDLLLRKPVITCVTPSKKKNLEMLKVLTSMAKLAATHAVRVIMLTTRMTLRTT